MMGELILLAHFVLEIVLEMIYLRGKWLGRGLGFEDVMFEKAR